MFCQNCGSNIPDGSGFCPNCGAPMGGGPQYQQPFPQAQFQQPRYQQPYQQPQQWQNYSRQQPQKKKPGLIKTALLCALVVILLNFCKAMVDASYEPPAEEGTGIEQVLPGAEP